MAKMVLANGKKAKLLDQQRTYLNTLRYRLFTAVAGGTLDGTKVKADFTEVVDSGYAYQVPVFTAATLNGSNQAQLVAPVLTWTFTFSGGVAYTIKGYFTEDPADGTLVYSQFGAADVTVTAAGATYSVIPQMLDDTMP